MVTCLTSFDLPVVHRVCIITSFVYDMFLRLFLSVS